VSSNIDDAVKATFDRVIEDFDKSCKEGTAIFWNEDTFRMDFFRHLCEQDLKIKRFFSEFEINLWGKRYRPDLVVHVESKDELDMIAFEFKFYSRGWKKDWEKVRNYLKEGFTYGYFLAIGTKSLADELSSRPEVIDSYQAEALIYQKTTKEAFSYAPSFRIAEDLLRKTLDMPYTISIILQLAATILKDYAIIYQFQKDKCLLLTTFPEEEKWNRIEKELANAGLNNFLNLKENEWTFETTHEFNGIALIAELHPDSRRSTVLEAKKALRKLIPVLSGLKPTFKLK